MDIKINKYTGLAEARRALEVTCNAHMTSRATLHQIYTWMHSPMRTQTFEIILTDIFSFVAGHLARHVTTTPFIKTSRNDRGEEGVVTRYTLVNMIIWANAEAVLSMAGKRLCHKASPETRDTVIGIKEVMEDVDFALSRHMQPQCVYQGGYCREPKPCGMYAAKRYDPEVILRRITF